ncbi:MAG: hypothetical protein Q8941_13330 [Bacteroidota bacterium]|nr:hypothetical protein [Bacteroidota bacterium]
MIHPNKFPRPLYGLLPVMMLACIIINPFNAPRLQAQETQKPAEAKAAVQLSPEQWKAVEGVFQSPQNNEMNVQFTAKEKVLVVKLLWNNNEISLTPESPLTFFSNDANEGRPLRISFIKDSTGAITRVSVVNNEIWKRVKDYKPVVKTEMQHTPAQLKPFEGLYLLQNTKDRFIQFSVKGNNLVLKQHWDGNEIPFVPESELDFYSKESPLFSLTFTKENDGTISQVLAFKRDRWFKVKKIQPAPDQLKVIEGKYQLKDDPDNYIQITAKGTNLVVKQLWDGKEIVLEPQTETYFYNNSESYPLRVIKDNSGMVTGVEVLGVDLFNKVKE